MEMDDYNAEPHHVDGGLAHVQERLICYVAQDAGYTTEQIISSHLAGWNYAMMEYKLQKLSLSCRILTSTINIACGGLVQPVPRIPDAPPSVSA